jgi:8-oxo-dGTP pyrophosphatase MutT (NUDIX family)
MRMCYMDEEFSAGAIIFRRKGKKILFLLIYSKRNDIWGFPKGHIEGNEKEKDAALREIQEEVGLTELRFINDFKEEEIYPAIGTRGEFRDREIIKHSIYFLCETDEKKVIVDGTEISKFRWLSFSKAKDLLSFESQKMLLERAYSILEDETAELKGGTL